MPQLLPPEIKAIQTEVLARGLRDPVQAYNNHRLGARKRGIEFTLTFQEWWGIWKDYYHLRGAGKNGLCMGREGDKGGYTIGNVYLTTKLGNLRDYRKSDGYIELRTRQKDAQARKNAWAKKGNVRGSVAGAVGVFNWRETHSEEKLDELE